jgi:hypothetical protein
MAGAISNLTLVVSHIPQCLREVTKEVNAAALTEGRQVHSYVHVSSDGGTLKRG